MAHISGAERACVAIMSVIMSVVMSVVVIISPLRCRSFAGAASAGATE